MQALRGVTGYYRLLLAASPSPRDLITLFLGIIAAIAAGVPFPIIGILFGQLLDDFNDATCSDDQASRNSDQGNINGRILIIVYLAIVSLAKSDGRPALMPF